MPDDRITWDDGQIEILDKGKDPLKNFPAGGDKSQPKKGRQIDIMLPDDPNDEPIVKES